MKTNRTLKATVGTTKKSTDTRSFTWLSRKARHVGEGGFVGRTMYFSTVALATAMPSLASSPTMRGEPQSGFAVDILPMRSRTAFATAGLPALGWERRAQWSQNLRRCHAMTVLGWTKTRTSRQPVQVRESHAHRRRSATLMRARAECRW